MSVDNAIVAIQCQAQERMAGDITRERAIAMLEMFTSNADACVCAARFGDGHTAV